MNFAITTSLISRIAHQSRYLFIGLALGLALASLQPLGSTINAVSLVAAYASIALLCITMLFGPLHVLNGGRPIVTTSNRRHLGVWSGAFAIVHVVAGLNVHMGGRYLDYFFTPEVPGSMRSLRLDAFGAANHVGLLATLLVTILMFISRDRWLRSIGPAPWKRLQRSAYWLIGLAFAHGFIYQALERRRVLPVLALVLMLVAIVGYQLAGRTKWRVREAKRKTEARPGQTDPA